MAPPRAFVVHDPGLDLGRGGLATGAPGSWDRLEDWCRRWAGEVGWTVTDDLRAADGVVVGPGGAPPAHPNVVRAVPGRGLDGYRWALHHLAWRTGWPPQTVPYGPHPDQVADLRLPRQPARGTAVLLHGGFWLEPWRRDLMDGPAVDLARRGWATWNVEYRRLGGGGGWPRTGRDVLDALDRIGDDVALVGHSAGATLALWAAGEHRVSKVVALAAVCDLEAAVAERLGGGAVEQFLAGESPAAVSPLRRVPPPCPVVLVHGADDTLVPVGHSRRYADAVGAAGGDATLDEPAGADHFSLIVPGRHCGQVAAALDG